MGGLVTWQAGCSGNGERRAAPGRRWNGRRNREALTHSIGSPGQLHERSIRHTVRRLAATILRITARPAAISAGRGQSSIIVSDRK